MRRSNRHPPRRGAAAVEAAITIPVFLVLVLGMIDLGVAVTRYNALSLAARHGARQAAVHGSLAPAGWYGGPWGPAAINQSADATGVGLVDTVAPLLVACPLADSRVQATWPDGTNAPGDRVRVTVTTPYTPIVTYILGGETITLTSSSTTLISH